MEVISSSTMNTMWLRSKHKPPVLISLQKPPDTTDTDNAIRDIYKHAPVYKDGLFYWWTSCYGKIHRNTMYGIPLEDLLKMVETDSWVWTLYYYVSDNHHLWPEFSPWWRSKCTPSRIDVNMNQVVYVVETKKYLKISNIISASGALVYPGFDHMAVCAGRAIKMGSVNLEYVSADPNTFTEIHNDENIITFATHSNARCFYISNKSKSIFINFLRHGLPKKITLGAKAGNKRHKETLGDAAMVWNNFIVDKLRTNNINFSEKSGHVKWTNTRAEARNIFELDESFEKKDKKYIYFMEQLDFDINFTNDYCILNCVMLKEQIKKVGTSKRTVIEGIQYLRQTNNN